ncbi:MAG: family 20 glycosylhydrolase [Armatimonadota bacterium]|nr:family 20 glycosylhydrolase [Armatimonadota bacterium]
MTRAVLSLLFFQIMSNAWAQSLIPQPSSLTLRSGSFTFNRDTRVDAGDNAWPAVEKLWSHLRPAVGSMLPANGRKENVLVFKVDESRKDLGTEGYQLDIRRDSIYAVAATSSGLFYASQTLRQMLPASSSERQSVRCAEIMDLPRFSWRGLHLDVSRHFFPADVIKKEIDLAAMFKLNVFHWHLTDDGGWRMESKKYPKLTTVGAWRTDTGELWSTRTLEFPGPNSSKKLYGGFYTQEYIKQIVAYARGQNVTVVPEIELPGHSMAAVAAYPHLACDMPNPAAFKRGNPYPHPNVFCAGKESTFEFLEAILDETMAIFPSEFIHIGGDEVDRFAWSQCPSCKKRMQKEGLKDYNELQSYFIRRIEKHINKRGRRMIGWDEILEGGLAPNATVMSWRGVAGGIAAAKAGHAVIMSPTSHSYFDYPYSTTPTEKVYGFDPIPQEIAGQASLVLGGQANVWTEWLDTTEKIEVMMLPRLLAMAEALWTPPNRKNYADFSRRLIPWYRRLEKLGYGYHLPAPSAPVSLAVFRKGAQVEFANAAVPSWDVRFTTDGRDPQPSSELLPAKMRFDKPTRLRMATFTPTGKRSEVIEFNAVQSDGLGIHVVGYEVKKYRGEWAKLPDFSRLVPSSTSRADVAEVANSDEENYGLSFSGVFSVPGGGYYTFTVGSDDGSALYIAGAKAVDNDGLHGYEERSARVWLDAGTYPIEIRYFQAGGAARLAALVEGPDMPKRKL